MNIKNQKNMGAYALMLGFGAIVVVASCAGQQTNDRATVTNAEAKIPAFVSGTLPKELIEASGVTPLPGLPDDQALLVGDKDLAGVTVSQAVQCFNSGNFSNHVRAIESELKDSLAVNDMEDVAWDAKRRMAFVVVSGSKNSDNEFKPRREKFARFAYDERTGQFTGQEISKFKDQIVRAFPELGPAVQSNSRFGGDDGTFNMEGAAFVPESNKLLLGFRSPTHNGDAIVITVDNPHEMFDKNADPDFEAKAQYLDLKGQGVRGFYYDEERQGCWIVSGESANADDVPREGWKLWFWNLRTAPVEKTVEKGELKNAEGVCRMSFRGQPGLLFIEDAGHAKNAAGDDEARPCRYLLTAMPQ